MAKRKVRMEISARGYYEVEIDENLLKPMLNEDGDDFSEEVLDDIQEADLFNLGSCGEQLKELESLVWGDDVMNSLEFTVQDIELVKPKKHGSPKAS